MSGFIAAWHRDGEPVEPARASAMLAALAHRGPDGERLLVRPAAALGHRHFWTTPEEVGETQPLSNEDAGLDVVFDGRLDNRAELLAALGGGDTSSSDAALVLRAFEKWGETCFERLLGPFAAVVLDARARRLVAARDGMGSRTLYYRSNPRLALVASEERALLAYTGASGGLDEVALAEFFALSVPRGGRTFYEGITELLPGHVLVVSQDGVRLRRYWRPDAGRRIWYRSDQEYAEHFRSLLAESVRCRLRTVGPPGVMLSGGMDSTSVAAFAATELRRRGEGPLLSFSWVFDELTDCDERKWIGPMVETFGLDAAWIPGDDAWPLREFDRWPVGSNQPWSNAYEPLKQALYSAAAARGCRVLFNPVFADSFYTGDEEWLTDLVREGHFLEAGRGLLGLLREGPGALVGDGGVRRLARRVLRGASFEPERARASVPWLTDRAWNLLILGACDDPAASVARRPGQYEALFGPDSCLHADLALHTNGCGIERRDPFRDRRLAEFAIAIPAHQLFRRGRTKHVQRNAMTGILPAEITERTVFTGLSSLFLRGLGERGVETARAVLSRKDAVWRAFVREDWLRDFFPGRVQELFDTAAPLVVWQCVCAQAWRDKLEEADRRPS